MKIVPQSVSLVWYTPNPQEIIESAGRTCYKSEDRIATDSSINFIRTVIKSGHESVLEHASASFRIITDRAVCNEIVRHRIASYSQESSRYCNYSANRFGREISIIEPPNLVGDAHLAWFDGVKAAEQAYFALIESGQPPQIARSVLPSCLKTELVMTTNFRSWRNFMKLRLPPTAHPQIRDVAKSILEKLKSFAPTCFEEFE